MPVCFSLSLFLAFYLNFRQSNQVKLLTIIFIDFIGWKIIIISQIK